MPFFLRGRSARSSLTDVQRALSRSKRVQRFTNHITNEQRYGAGAASMITAGFVDRSDGDEVLRSDGCFVKRVFSPIHLATLEFWQKASFGVTLSGPDVASILDKSGNGYTSSGNLNPLLVSADADFGGKDSISFNGTDEILETAVDLTGLAGSAGMTIFIALMKTGAGAMVPLGKYNIGSQGTFATQISAPGAIQIFIPALVGDSPSLSADTTTNTPVVIDTPFIVAFRYDGTQSAAVDKVGIYYNGGTTLTNSASAALPATLTSGTAITETGGLASASSYWAGEIAETIICSSALTDGEMNSVGTYLSTEYSLTWNTLI